MLPSTSRIPAFRAPSRRLPPREALGFLVQRKATLPSMESLKRRSLLPIAAGLLLVGANCENQALPARSAPVYASQNHPVDELATRVLQCPADMEGNPSPGQDWFVFYAVDSMTRKLRSYPSLAEYAGLNSVSSCAEAKIYAQAYDDYSQRHPNFEDSPDPKGSADEAKSLESQRLPRLKIRGGARDRYYDDYFDKKVSPIVEIMPVYWFQNGATPKQFKNAAGQQINEFCETIKSCTATFINKNSLLTAAHCMQNVRKKSVRDNPPAPPGQDPLYCAGINGEQPLRENPPTDLTGQSSWLVVWPSLHPGNLDDEEYSRPHSPEWPQLYIGTPITGLRAYQHPHPKYSLQINRDHRYDLAILGFDASSTPEAVLPPDMARQGGTVYIKSSFGNDYSYNEKFLMAGYGLAQDANGNPTPDDTQRLKFAEAMPDICWGEFFAEGTFKDVDGERTGTCKGDSGGPLYKAFPAANDKPPRIVQYGVLSHTTPVAFGCDMPGSTSHWSRLEKDDVIINWINDQIGEIYAFSTRYPRCNKPPLGLGLGDVWQCWGEPCGGIDNLKCNDPLQSCTGAGDPKKECSVCPSKTCDCVVGECVADYGKIKSAHDRKEAGL